MKHIAFVAVLLASLAASAESTFVTINCDDPEGFLIDHGENPLRGPGIYHEAKTTERFGSKPTFILDSKRPNKLIVLWGSYIPPGVSQDLVRRLDLETKAGEAEIVFRNDRQITGIESYEQGVYTYSLYPKLNYGIFTTSAHWVIDEHATASINYGRCSFSE